MTDHNAEPTDARPTQPSSTPVFRRVLGYGLLFAAVVALASMLVGGLTAGGPGVVSGLIGAAMAAVFLSITALSMLVANRFIGSDLYVGLFFGIVLGSWIVKFVLFLALALALRDQPWIQPLVLFLSLIVCVLGSLVLDVIVVTRSRIPYVSDSRLPKGKR
jgi:hypothetical protein